jgi:Ca2+-binding EF-hand superfamily protein
LGGILPTDLPSWFHDVNTDDDGQIGLYEWRKSGRRLEDFRQYDLNDDGFLSPEEILRHVRKPIELRFKNSRVRYDGAIEELPEDRYKGKKSFKTLSVKLDAGRAVQIDLHSRVMQAFVYLEDPDGSVVKENSSPNIGGNSRLVYRVDRAGTYRIIATSLGGFRTGPFSCSIRLLGTAIDNLPKELSWFNDLDKDGDGQVALYEWREAGKNLDDFRVFDLNDDGFITVEEIRRYINKFPELQKLGR